MRVKGIRWVGIGTGRFDEMRRFAVDVLGLRAHSEAPGFLKASAENGDVIELFGPAGRHPEYQFASNPQVVGFLVDDIETAREELAAAPGVELLGELNIVEGGYAWQHFRAPDGCVYELTFDPDA